MVPAPTGPYAVEFMDGCKRPEGPFYDGQGQLVTEEEWLMAELAKARLEIVRLNRSIERLKALYDRATQM